MNLLEYIPTGQNNPITSRDLERLTGMSGAEIRGEIHRLRLAGHPIGSDTRGYFIATTAEELGHTIRSLDSRARHINDARLGLLDAQHNLIFGGTDAIHDTHTTENQEEPSTNRPREERAHVSDTT